MNSFLYGQNIDLLSLKLFNDIQENSLESNKNSEILEKEEDNFQVLQEKIKNILLIQVYTYIIIRFHKKSLKRLNKCKNYSI